MHRRALTALVLLLPILCLPTVLVAQGHGDPAALLAAQREAMDRFAMMDGVWRGPAWVLAPSGEKHALTQTERVGPFLDGTIRMIEGKGYEEDGSVGFHALGVISFDPAARSYTMRSYARGQVGDFPITPTDDGFAWEIAAGPMTIRYTATIQDGTWHEVGDRVRPDGETVRFYEMTLTRVGDTEWPAAGAVGLR
jgi:hypothetical protein